jgi:hypothetical protein
MVLCPLCRGHDYIPVFVKAVEGKEPDLEALVNSDFLKCQLCKGTKEVTQEVADRYARGREFSDKRKKACYGPREYAETMGILPSDLMKMEIGLIEPVPFMEPPLLTMNIAVSVVSELMKERDDAQRELNWLRLMFFAEAQGLIYENDNKTCKQVSPKMIIYVDDRAIPIRDVVIESELLRLLQERSDARSDSDSTRSGGDSKGFGAKTPAAGRS